jgi:hypothetical protein
MMTQHHILKITNIDFPNNSNIIIHYFLMLEVLLLHELPFIVFLSFLFYLCYCVGCCTDEIVFKFSIVSLEGNLVFISAMNVRNQVSV